MKKVLKKSLSVLLSILLVISVMTVGVLCVSAEGDDIGDYPGQLVDPETGEPIVDVHDHVAGQDWLYSDSQHWHKCTVCGEKMDVAAHTASDWQVETEATTQAAGLKKKVCTICDAVLQTEEIPMITYIPGDINGDGKVNNKDVTRLFQYVTGWPVQVNELALDVNGDGKKNNKDVTRLFQYVTGWPVEIH